MSELDALEAVSGFTANAIAAFTVYFSFTFAYLTASYFVGSHLSKFQAAAVSFLYVVSAVSAALTVIGCQQAVAEIQISHPSPVIDQLLLWDIRYWHYYVVILFTSVIMLSLYFLYDCRKVINENMKTPPNQAIESDA